MGEPSHNPPTEGQAPDALLPPELVARLEASSIAEVLRIQDQLARFVRERYERPLAVLFCDIVDSTAFFERYGDAEGRRMIQRFNDSMAPIVQHRGGRLVKTIGDAVMATFPSAQVAIDAAIEMQQAVQDGNQQAAHPEEQIQIRVGVNHGTALVNDKDGDVYGDMVNVAARVQSQAAKGQILISDALRDALPPTVPAKPAGKFALKGKSQTVFLYEVLWQQVPRRDAQLERPNLGKRYEVLEMLGSGGMAVVWRARDEKIGRDVAIKVLHRHLQISPATREQFHREAVVAGALTHENIVQIYDCSIAHSQASYIAMELVEGRTLRDFFEKKGKLEPLPVALLAHELARGLAYAHGRGVIHRDLKPENILLSAQGSVKIGDFGIACVGELSRLNHSGIIAGTPLYLSPEQVRGEPADSRSDLFSVGVLLYELAVGCTPFGGESSTAIMYQIVQGTYPLAVKCEGMDPELGAIIDKCLAPKAEDRFANADELVAQLRVALDKKGVGDPRSALTVYFLDGKLPASPEVQQERRLPRWAAAGSGALAAAMLALVAHYAIPSRRAPAPRVAPQVLVGGAQLAAIGSPSAPVGAASPAEATALTAPVPFEVPKALARSAPPLASPSAMWTVERQFLDATRKVVAEEKGQPSSALKPVLKEARAISAPAMRVGTLKVTPLGDWADIKVDGVVKGRAAAARVFELPVGRHLLEVINPSRKPYRAEVLIEQGKTLERVAQLK